MHIRPINPVRISQEKLKSKGEKTENAKGKTRHTCAPTVLAIFRTNSKDSRPSLSPASCRLFLGDQGKRMIKCHNQFQFGARIELR